MIPIDIRRLGFGAKTSICWSFFWRGILITFGSALTGALVGALLGALVGFSFGAAGLSLHSIRVVSQLLGAVFGVVTALFFLYFYVRWLLGSRLGGYRLILVAADEHSERSFQPTAVGGR